jgi:hypothetical protein
MKAHWPTGQHPPSPEKGRKGDAPAGRAASDRRKGRKGAWSRSSLLTVYQPSRRRQRVAQLRAGGPPAKGNAGYFRRALCARLRLARRLTCSPATMARRIAANVAKLPDLLGRRAAA